MQHGLSRTPFSAEARPTNAADYGALIGCFGYINSNRRAMGSLILADNRRMDATTFPVECRYCGNKGTMQILAQARQTEEHENNDDPMFPIEWEAGNIYYTLRCYTCSGITFYQFSVHTGTDPEYIDRSYDQTLYPVEGESPMLRHSREMTLLYSRNLTQQPAFGGDDIAFPTFGLRTKARRLRWVTLSEQKWVILAERRGTKRLSG